MNEKLSSLFDNELNNNEIDKLLEQTSKHKENNHWAQYQLIRDVIQNNHLGSNKLTKKLLTLLRKNQHN